MTKGYYSINGALISLSLFLIMCIGSDLVGINAPHAAGSYLRFQMKLIVINLDEWRKD